MVVETLMEQDIPRIATLALEDAGLPSDGLPKVLLASTLSLFVGGKLVTDPEDPFRISIDDTYNPTAGQPLNRIEHLTAELTMNLVRGLTGEEYPVFYHHVGHVTTITLYEGIAELF